MKSVVFISSIKDIPGLEFTANGQSIVTSSTYEFLCSRFRLFAFPHGKSLLTQIYLLPKLITSFILVFLFRSIYFNYIVISRSRFGFLRDTFIILFLCLFRKPTLIHVHGRTLPRFISFAVLHVLKLPFSRPYIRLVLPSLSFLECNPGWSVFAHTEISNFCEDFPFSQKNIIPNKTSKTNRTIIRLTWNSNLIYSKGISLLMEAIYIFNCTSRTHSIHIDVFGDYLSDEYCSHSELETIVKQMSLLIPCCFYGPVDRSSTISILSSSDLYVFPSFYSSEFQPLSVIDAMACGIPIISSSLPVLRHMLRDYDRVTYLPVKVTAFNLASSLHSFINSSFRDSSDCPSYSSRQFSYTREKFINSFSTLISSI